MSAVTHRVPMRPPRDVGARVLRFFPSLVASSVAAIGFLVVYYLTLGLLPAIFAYPVTEYPFAAWAHRFDLAQLFGAFVDPPYPSPLNWWLGFVILFGYLVVLGPVYACGLSWAQQRSSTVKGILFGITAAVNLLLTLWIADGFVPAIMRNALPDTSFFMLGWSWWALYQMLLAHIVYGGILGRLYARR